MHIPSYDELTPPIPDVSPADVFDVRRVLPFDSAPSGPRSWQAAGGPVECPERAQEHASRRALYACLHSPRRPDVILPIAKDFSPRLQRYGAAAVVLDVSGLGRLLGDADAIAAELAREARERAKGIHVAIAPTQMAALLLAYAQAPLTRGPVVIASAPAGAALAPIPLTVLQAVVAEAFGEGGAAHQRTFDVLRRWGLTTIGEFAALPPVELSERLGQQGLALQRLACGFDRAPLVPDPGVPRYVQSIELEWPVEQLEALSFVLARLLEPLSAALERADRSAAAIRVDLRLVDRTAHARVLQLPAAMRDPRVLRTLVLLDLESHPPSAGIDVVTIEVDPAPSRIIQYSLLERARPSAETVATLTARLNALVGEPRVGSAALVDTHRPDGFQMRRFAPSETRSSGLGLPAVAPSAKAGTRGSGLGARGSIESGVRVPSPESRVPCLRRFRPPIAIRVAVERGRPVAVPIDRRGMPGGRIERAAGPWRTSGAWWQADGTHWDRDEWDIQLSDSTLCRIFHDRHTEQWFMEGCID